MIACLLRHCKSSLKRHEIPIPGRCIIEGSVIYSTTPVPAKEALPKSRYLWRMRKIAAYRCFLRIHYERMVADDDPALDPDAP